MLSVVNLKTMPNKLKGKCNGNPINAAGLITRGPMNGDGMGQKGRKYCILNTCILSQLL